MKHLTKREKIFYWLVGISIGVYVLILVAVGINFIYYYLRNP
jgi:hypothetical protein